MRKKIFICFAWLTLSLLLTLSSYLTWANACPDFQRAYSQIPEGAGTGGGYSGMCAGDGIQFVGVLFNSLIVSAGFLFSLKFVLYLLDLNLDNNKNNQK